MLEHKDAAGGNEPDIKDAVKSVMTAFEEFKASNDERLKEIETKGTADPLIDEKLTKITAELDKFEGLNQRLTQAEAQKAAIADLEAKFDRIETAMSRTGTIGTKEAKILLSKNWARAVFNASSVGAMNISEEERKALDDVVAEAKALNLGTNTEGGYLAPTEMVREIIKGATEISNFRGLVTVRQTANKSIEIPKRTGQFAAVRVAEMGTRSETTGLAWGMEEVPVHELYAIVDISHSMMEDAAYDMVAEITSESIEQFAVKEGAEFVTGTGVGMAEGFTVNADVATTNSGTATTIADANGQADGLLTLKHAIKTAYGRNATWVMNRTTLGSVRKLKDGNNQYIWAPGIASGAPNTIDGDPYVELPDMPSEAAGAKAVAYGDFRRAYTWVDRMQMIMQRDDFTQADSGKIRFRLRKRSSGRVVLAEAIRTLTCAA